MTAARIGHPAMFLRSARTIENRATAKMEMRKHAHRELAHPLATTSEGLIPSGP